MPINLNDVNILCGCNDLTLIQTAAPLPPFDESVCNFLHALSVVLLADKESKAYSDIITFAFFCRKANINTIKSEYSNKLLGRVGRGISFHVAPSNVPINFAYTLVVGLLAGNACVVKASSKDFAQTQIVSRCMQGLLSDEYSELLPYVTVVQYPREMLDATEYFSKICNFRVIWGGDETVAQIRKAPLAPRSFDIAFADRYSLAVFNAEEMCKEKNIQRLAKAFYNDTYLYDQNACSSPRLIIWLGSEEAAKSAQSIFWNALHLYTAHEYKLEPVLAVDKYTAACRCAIDLESVHCADMPDNIISRIMVEKLDKSLPKYRCAGGSFIEYRAETLEEIADIVDEKYQTLSYYGFDANELRNWVVSKGLRGIDRIVPIGDTASFSLVWDGYDLITSFTRQITIL